MPNRGTHASLSQGTMPRCGLFLLRSKCSRSLLERFHAFLTDPGGRRRTREALPNRHPIPQSNVTDYRVLGNLTVRRDGQRDRHRDRCRPPRGILRRSSLRPVMTPIQPIPADSVRSASQPKRISTLDVGQPFVIVAIVASRRLSRNTRSMRECRVASTSLGGCHLCAWPSEAIEVGPRCNCGEEFLSFPVFFPGRRCKITVNDEPCGIV